MKLLPLYRQSKEQLTEKTISDCRKGSARAQRQLFEMYYSEGMNTAQRYSNNSEDAKEILAMHLFVSLKNWINLILLRYSFPGSEK